MAYCVAEQGSGCGNVVECMAGEKWVWQGGMCGRRKVSAGMTGIRYGRQQHVTSHDLHIAG